MKNPVLSLFITDFSHKMTLKIPPKTWDFFPRHAYLIPFGEIARFSKLDKLYRKDKKARQMLVEQKGVSCREASRGC